VSIPKSTRKDAFWDIEFVSPQAANASAAKLTSFAKHKTELLAILRATYQRGPKTKPFDANKAWQELIWIAEFYFKEAEFRRRAVPVSRRVERLRQIASSLIRARNLIDKTVGADLIKGWCAEANIPPDRYILNREGSVLTRVADQIEDVVANLSTLARAAHRATVDIRPERGRPKGTVVLPSDCIRALAAVYTAVGPRVLTQHSVVDLIKRVRF
jgi:hypothetical protein